MSDAGPPTYVVVGMLLGSLALVTAIGATLVFLSARKVRAWLGPTARMRLVGIGAASLFIGSLALAASRATSIHFLQAQGEEIAFWLVAAGASVVAGALLARRRLA